MEDYELEMLEEIDRSIENDGYIDASIGQDLIIGFEEERLSCEYCNDHYYEIETLCKVGERFFIVEWLRGTDETPNQYRKVYEVIPEDIMKPKITYRGKDYKIEFLFNKINKILTRYDNDISYDIECDDIILVNDYSNGKIYKILQEHLEKEEIESIFFCFKDE